MICSFVGSEIFTASISQSLFSTISSGMNFLLIMRATLPPALLQSCQNIDTSCVIPIIFGVRVSFVQGVFHSVKLYEQISLLYLFQYLLVCFLSFQYSSVEDRFVSLSCQKDILALVVGYFCITSPSPFCML